jgi:hypothetical protein
MVAFLRNASSRRVQSWCAALVLSVVLLAQMALPFTLGSRVRAQVDPLTVGGLVVLIDFLSNKINGVIATASDETRLVLDDLNGKLKALKDELTKDVQSTVNVSLTSLDNLSRTKLYEVQQLLSQVNAILDQGVDKIQGATLNVLRNAALTVAQSAESVSQAFNRSVVVATEAGLFLIDRTTNNIITIGALFLLLIGLLIIGVSLLKYRPTSLFQWVLLLVVFGLFVGVGFVFTFLPNIRMQALGSVGFAQQLEGLVNQPRVIGYEPHPVIVGQNRELVLIGANLRPNGTQPSASVGGVAQNVIAAADQRLVIDIGILPAPANANVNVQLQYPNATPGPVIVVNMVTPTPMPQPVDLALTSFSLSAASVEINQQVTASLVVQNVGGSRSNAGILLRVNTGGPATADARQVPALSPGQTASIQVPFSYAQAGTYRVTATLDMSPGELNGANNTTSPLTVNVLTPVVTQSYESAMFTRVNWPGSRGTDTINGNATAGPDCRITSALVDIHESDRKSSRILTTIGPGQADSVGSGATWGINFIEGNLNTNIYRVVLNWWQDIHLVLHYKLRYTVRGRNCQTPPFTMESVRR